MLAATCCHTTAACCQNWCPIMYLPPCPTWQDSGKTPWVRDPHQRLVNLLVFLNNSYFRSQMTSLNRQGQFFLLRLAEYRPKNWRHSLILGPFNVSNCTLSFISPNTVTVGGGGGDHTKLNVIMVLAILGAEKPECLQQGYVMRLCECCPFTKTHLPL